MEGRPLIGTRIMFEHRVFPDGWALDTFIKGPGYNQTLVFLDKRHPLGRWAHVAQTFDGTTYRSFVNGELQGEGRRGVQAPGDRGGPRSDAGSNRVNYLHGAIAEARFTKRFLRPDQFTGVGPE